MIWLLAILMTSSLGDTASQMTLEEVQRLMSRTEADMRQNMLGFKAATKKGKAKAKKWVLRGIQAHENGEYDQALKFYQKALKRDPQNYVIYFQMGFCHSVVGDHKQALEAAIQAHILNPEAEEPHLLKASMLDNLGFLDLALQEFTLLLEAHPQSMMVQINYGVTLIRSGDTETGKQAYLKAIEIDPKHPSPYYHLAYLARIRNHDIEERKYLEFFIKHGQSDPRLATAKKRMKELNQIDVEISGDKDQTAMAIMESMARALWKKMHFETTFPDKKGYEPTMEEELFVHKKLLKMWREYKEKHPDASEERYDVMVAADEKGFFETLVYAFSVEQFPTEVRAYFDANMDHTNAFLKWTEGVSFFGKSIEPEGQEITLAQLVIMQMEESETTFTIKPLEDPDKGQVFWQEESRRYQQSLKQKGGHKLNDAFVSETLKNLAFVEREALSLCFSYLQPEDSEWQACEKQLSRYNLRLKKSPIPKPFPGALGDPTTEIYLDLSQSTWLLYWGGKSTFQNESRFRETLGIKAAYKGPTIGEEYYAFIAAVQGYLGQKESDDFTENPFFEFLVDVYDRQAILGFVLYEVIHRYYGVRLSEISDLEKKAILDYFYGFATENISK